MKKYSILVIEHEGERELCQCDANAEAIAQAIANQKIYSHGRRIPKYQSVRIVENKQ